MHCQWSKSGILAAHGVTSNRPAQSQQDVHFHITLFTWFSGSADIQFTCCARPGHSGTSKWSVYTVFTASEATQLFADMQAVSVHGMGLLRGAGALRDVRHGTRAFPPGPCYLCRGGSQAWRTRRCISPACAAQPEPSLSRLPYACSCWLKASGQSNILSYRKRTPCAESPS